MLLVTTWQLALASTYSCSLQPLKVIACNFHEITTYMVTALEATRLNLISPWAVKVTLINSSLEVSLSLFYMAVSHFAKCFS